MVTHYTVVGGTKMSYVTIEDSCDYVDSDGVVHIFHFTYERRKDGTECNYRSIGEEVMA